MSGLSEEELENMKTRADWVLDTIRDHDPVTIQLAADIRMLLLDKKIKGDVIVDAAE